MPRRPTTMLLLTLTAALLTGCDAAPSTDADSPAGLPQPLQITLQSQSADGRATYYELSRDGSLGFGGGRDGRYRIARPIGKLTDEQRLQLWAIIREHKLLDLDGAWLVTDWDDRRYEMKIKAGGESNSVTIADADTPGLDALEAKLFEFQGSMRYDGLFRPIDEAIRKSDGGVKKSP